MTKRPKPTNHGRDHEHGGADPQRIHYEDVGGPGAGDAIRFDVANVGHGLSIETHDGGIFLDSHGDGATLEIQAHDDGSIEIRSHGGPIVIASGGGPISIASSGGGVTIDGTPFP